MYGRQIMGTSDDSVLRAVLHDLIHGFELPQIEFVMRNTDAWLYGWGILKIMFNDPKIAENLVDILQSLNGVGCGALIESFIRAVDSYDPNVNSQNGVSENEWIIEIGICDSLPNLSNKITSFNSLAKVHLSAIKVKSKTLNQRVESQISDIVSKSWPNSNLANGPTQLPLLSFDNMLIPSCFSCNRELTLKNGGVAFFNEVGGFEHPEGPRTKSSIFHYSCMPEKTHHSIGLDQLKTKNDVLYWTAQYFSESWFLDSDWVQLFLRIFDIQTPGSN